MKVLENEINSVIEQIEPYYLPDTTAEEIRKLAIKSILAGNEVVDFLDRALIGGDGVSIVFDREEKTYTINAVGGGGFSGCAENVSCLIELPPSEPCVEGGAENVSCLI